jgi:hypothetical protein
MFKYSGGKYNGLILEENESMTYKSLLIVIYSLVFFLYCVIFYTIKGGKIVQRIPVT